MIQQVFECALQVPGTTDVVNATDDSPLADADKVFGGRFVMRSQDHPSGTDRLAEVMAKLEADVHIKLQGDEHLVRPADIIKLPEGMLADPAVQVGTLCPPIETQEALNPNSVKVVLANNGDALYFSCSPFPYPREANQTRYLKHLGIYAYRREVLAVCLKLPHPMLECADELEQ